MIGLNCLQPSSLTKLKGIRDWFLKGVNLFLMPLKLNFLTYFVLESIKSQPKRVVKAMTAEKILSHWAVSFKYLSMEKGINSTTKYQ